MLQPYQRYSTPQAYLLVLFGNFVPSAAKLAGAITAFTELKIVRVRWEPDDVMEFVYWVNDVLEKFSSTFTGRSNMQPSQVRDRCHIDDPPYREILQDIQYRRVSELEHHDTTSGDTLRLRMRFLSVSGCQSEDLGEGHDGRAHFVLKSLDPIVKAKIEKRFGGLKPQYKNR
ncbi:Hypothetical protein PHPALM_36998 [Phytophthora palmivora]|uniref:Uncharacterized protein n=1 Tax=Phytophthora palmivora TaxID=4796 RepID=A0A2P4WYJ6_9STRA|nr:Hypothetical protein PHPALM_36998 [Phytophthora palmivora]